MRMGFLAAALLVVFAPGVGADEPALPRDVLAGAKRILFLGDSITAGGQYVAFFDAWLTAHRGERAPLVLNCGLASETVSGLSEEGHAGGKFPRPDLHERLDRVLAIARPDLVFACYGINCGIYQPFSDERFQQYQAGYKRLKEKVEAAGAKLVVITPPFYDDLRSPRPFSYNDVLDRYAAWLVEQRKAGWLVVDLHQAMTAEIRRRRESEPKFTVQPDGVHPNADGHWLMARELLRACGDEPAAGCASPADWLALVKLPPEYLPLVQQRMAVLRDAHVAQAGHKRPGVSRGLPLPEAEQKAAELTAKIRALWPQ